MTKTFKQFVSEQPRHKFISHKVGNELSWANCAVGEYYRQVLFIDLAENEYIKSADVLPTELREELKEAVGHEDTYWALNDGELETYGDVLDSLNGDY